MYKINSTFLEAIKKQLLANNKELNKIESIPETTKRVRIAKLVRDNEKIIKKLNTEFYVK